MSEAESRMASETDQELRKTSALLDTLLPGGEGFPAARETGIDHVMMRQHADADWMRLLLSDLDDGFSDRSSPNRIEIVAALESSRPVQFQQFLAAAYGAYYTTPAVLAAISAKTGYRHPPQPAGYAMPAFDERILEKVRRDPPSWRNAPSANIEGSKP
jgi:hypothetical protein